MSRVTRMLARRSQNCCRSRNSNFLSRKVPGSYYPLMGNVAYETPKGFEGQRLVPRIFVPGICPCPFFFVSLVHLVPVLRFTRGVLISLPLSSVPLLFCYPRRAFSPKFPFCAPNRQIDAPRATNVEVRADALKKDVSHAQPISMTTSSSASMLSKSL